MLNSLYEIHCHKRDRPGAESHCRSVAADMLSRPDCRYYHYYYCLFLAYNYT